MILVDTHCHLDSDRYAVDEVAALLDRAACVGVSRVVTVGTDLDSSRRAVALAESDARVWAAVGISPNDIGDSGDAQLRALSDVARSRRVVAIGEIGLDYHWLRSPADRQKALFAELLALADEHALPVVIHSREAHHDTAAALTEWTTGRVPQERPVGVMHCFSGDVAAALACVGIGLLVSLAGNVTYRNAAALREVAAVLPEEALVLETDAPYLAPEPSRGSRNTPAGVRAVAECVADARGVPLGHLAGVTSANAARLFGWSPWPS